jgi:hypothetical protein
MTWLSRDIKSETKVSFRLLFILATNGSDPARSEERFAANAWNKGHPEVCFLMSKDLSGHTRHKDDDEFRTSEMTDRFHGWWLEVRSLD